MSCGGSVSHALRSHLRQTIDVLLKRKQSTWTDGRLRSIGDTDDLLTNSHVSMTGASTTVYWPRSSELMRCRCRRDHQHRKSGDESVPVAEASNRVVLVIERIANLSVLISVDTWKAAGTNIVNDLSEWIEGRGKLPLRCRGGKEEPRLADESSTI